MAGAEVEVFEVASAAGGSSALSGGEFYLGGGTPIQLANGFEDSLEDFRAYLKMSGGPGADEARVDLYAENAIGHFRWLAEQGIPFKGTYLPGKWTEPLSDDTLLWCGNEASSPYRDVARPAPRGHAAQMEGRGAGKLVMDKLIDRALALGVEEHLSARVLCLVADEQDAVQGIVVRIDGQPRFVRARCGVVLATGGFICNLDMLRQYAPDALAVGTPVTAGNDDGSGIRMGLSVHGAVTHMDQFFATKTTFPPESLVKGVFVNRMGQRFINEDAYHGRVAKNILRQPGGQAWLLLDNATFARPDSRPDIDIVAVGETWAEVEEELGLPEGELQHTMANYNRYAVAGHDPVLHKQPEWMQALTEPPFAALDYGPAGFSAAGFTLGGLLTLPTGEVLSSVTGAPIPGLYAAGRAACGLPRWGEGYSSGMSLGDSSFFGRQAGQSAASVRPT
jgi:3-oxo-5alpha-steroid 4-dehydrogenase